MTCDMTYVGSYPAYVYCRRNNELWFNLRADDTSNFVRSYLRTPTRWKVPYVANIGTAFRNSFQMISHKYYKQRL